MPIFIESALPPGHTLSFRYQELFIIITGSPEFAMGGASRSVNVTVRENEARSVLTEVGGYPYPMVNTSRSGGQEVGVAISASPSVISISSSVSRADSGTYTFDLYNSEGVATLVLGVAVACKLLVLVLRSRYSP